MFAWDERAKMEKLHYNSQNEAIIFWFFIARQGIILMLHRYNVLSEVDIILKETYIFVYNMHCLW